MKSKIIFRNLISSLIFLMAISNNLIYGQSCHSTTTGTPTARSGSYPAGGATWSGYNNITGNITVTGGTLTINSSAYVLVNSGKKITVASDGILVINKIALIK